MADLTGKLRQVFLFCVSKYKTKLTKYYVYMALYRKQKFRKNTSDVDHLSVDLFIH